MNLFPHWMAAARQLGFVPSEEQIVRLSAFSKLLLEWNEQINVTAIRTAEGVETLHFVDSLAGIMALTEGKALRVIDVGTGAGLPGLILKIVRPELNISLLDSIQKKAMVVEKIIEGLTFPPVGGDPGVRVLVRRAEDLGREAATRESWDVALARALAPMPVLLELCLPLVKVGGRLICWKKRGADEELAGAGRALRELGGSITQRLPVDLPGLPPDRELVIISKDKPCPPRYPRSPGIPKKSPL